ncbi:hypothetical protein NQD34_007493 [Periophthalmus magnuspinnatus]|nr:hypothetical protein NQD34_007493 [Periophthalmus magnuspinnatus]
MSVSNHNLSLRSHDHHPAPCRSPFRLRGLSLSARSRRKEEESLIDLVVRSQSQRLENQRAPVSLLQDPEPGPGPRPGPGSERGPEETVLDQQQETLLSLIHRVQSKRINEQRVLFSQEHT